MRTARFSPQVTTWLALLLPVFAWAPLTFSGYFILHSGFLPIFNLNDRLQHLTDPAWAPLIGQAHDLWRGEGALPYLLAALPRLTGAPAVTAVRFVFAASIVAGTLGTYVWARRHVGLWPGLVAALVYTLWPINLATIYVRGALAEAAFLGLMPWLLAAAARAVDTRRAGPAAVLAVLLAAAFWVQTGLAAWLGLVCLVYILFLPAPFPSDAGAGAARPRRSALIGWLAGWLVGWIGLAPVILRRGWGGDAIVSFTEHFVYPHQWLLAGWGDGPSISGADDTLPYQLGIVAFGLALCALVSPALAHEAGTPRPARRLLALAVGIPLVLALMSSTLSVPLWRGLPFLARSLTFPWQLLLLVGPWAALLAGFGARALAELLPDPADTALPLYAGLLALALLGSYAYLAPQTARTLAPDAPVAIFGDNELVLLRANVRGEPRPGALMTLETEWQALRAPAADYTVFFHAVGPDGTLWGQRDAMPRDGAAPTSGWLPGQVVTDTMRLTLQPDAPASADYAYRVGLYDWRTGTRLSVGVDDKVVLQP